MKKRIASNLAPAEASLTYALPGCAPTPASKLMMAFGIASAVERCADREAKFFWKGDTYMVTSRYSFDELLDRLLASFVLFPAFNPWNKGSGMIFEQEGSVSLGDKIARIADSEAPLCAELRDVIRSSLKLLKGKGGLPSKKEKPGFILEARKCITIDLWQRWASACVVISNTKDKKGFLKYSESYSDLLGTGGNIGKIDFGALNAECAALLFDLVSGCPSATAKDCFRAALLGEAIENTVNPKIGKKEVTINTAHLNPGADGIFDPKFYNKANGYVESGSNGNAGQNPAEMLLAIEGMAMFSGVNFVFLNQSGIEGEVVKGQIVAKYSLMVAAVGGASPTLASNETKGGMKQELFVPLSSLPMTASEYRRVIMDADRGRMPSHGMRDTLDFIRHACSWFSEMGITRFQRLLFVDRKGQAKYAISDGRYDAVAGGQLIDLAADLREHRHRLNSISRQEKIGVPPAIESAIRQIESETIAMGSNSGSVARMLEALGNAEMLMTLSACRDSTGFPGWATAWLKSIRAEWAELLIAEENTVETRIALALSSLPAIRRYVSRVRESEKGAFLAESGKINIYWANGDLAQSLIMLSERYSIEREAGRDLAFSRQRSLDFIDIKRFILGQIDELRIERLLFGLLALSSCSLDRPWQDGEHLAVAELPRIYKALAQRQWSRGFPDNFIYQNAALSDERFGYSQVIRRVHIESEGRLYPQSSILKFASPTGLRKRAIAAALLPLSVERCKVLTKDLYNWLSQ